LVRYENEFEENIDKHLFKSKYSLICNFFICLRFFFRFPADLTDTKTGFYQKCRIPNVVGAVDGTQIPIIAPKEDEASYVCRKGYHSINVQAVADTNLW